MSFAIVKDNCATPLHNFDGKRSREILAEQTGESHEQIRKFIRLTELIPELLDMVDENKIALRPAVELSYLAEKEQRLLYEEIGYSDCTPSHAQAIKMRKFAEQGQLNAEVISSIMQEEKPNQKEQFRMPREKISKYFPAGTPAEKIEDTITHLDKENHLHNHFVVNTVSFVDSIRYHRTGKDYHDMQVASDNLCREYGLSVIENIQYGKSKHYGEWKAEQEQRPTWRGFIKADIEEAIRMSLTEKQFFRHLEEKGYEIKIGKDISVRPQGKERFVRLMRNFGEEYSIDNIRRRILSQYIPEKPLAEPERKTRHYRMQGSMKSARKITGFRALYFHYCYKLGIFPKDRPQNRKRLHFLLREDLLKLNNISQEVRLLVRNKIDTAEQLSLYKNGLEVQIQKLSAERKALYKKQRTVKCQSDPKLAEAVKKEIDGLTEQLKALRREVYLCDDIAQRSGLITEKLKAVREDEQNQGKEKQQNEPIRRRS